MTDIEDSCGLCGLPVRAETLVEDSMGRFCCRGCREVYEVLGDRNPSDPDAVPPANGGIGVTPNGHESQATGSIESDDGPIGRERTAASGLETAFYRVEGMHCSTCETYLERVATGSEAIDTAEASYVTETVRIDYNPDRIDEPAIADRLSGLGYHAYRRDDELSRRSAENRHFGRLAAGVLFGMMVMLQYLVIIYPTYFGGFFYDDRTIEFLTTALATGSGRYFFIVIWILTSVVLFYTGGPILRGAIVSVRTRTPNMDLLITLAAMSAYWYSVLAIFLGRTDIYFDVTVAIIVIVTVGSNYERSIKREATERLADLTRARVDEARRIGPNGSEKIVSIADLSPGDRLLVKPGERIPVDGTLADSTVEVDESVVTGESLPKRRDQGDTVIGGSVVVDGAALIIVDEPVRSSVDRIATVVWDLQSGTHGIQRLADKLATIFVPAVAVLGVVVFGLYLGLGATVPAAMLVGLTVLIVSCPCALGLATPLAVASSVKTALDRGIVVFDDTVFERIRDVDRIVFDKTGTLTTGMMTVTRAIGPDDLFEKAAQIERRSSHPIATAIVSRFGPNESDNSSVSTDGGTVPAVDRQGDDADPVSDFTGYTRGIGGVVDGESMLVGHPSLFEEREWTIPATLETEIAAIRDAGEAPIVVGRQGTAEGVLAVGDDPRPEWEAVLERLAQRDTEIYVLTGDDRRASSPFVDHPAIDRVFAGVPPEAKAETIRRLGADGRTVMVGEGTNDAPALAAADLGIALGSGTAIAADAADVAILDDNLHAIEEVFDVADAAGRRVKQNIGWAFCYNAIAIPIAIAGLLNPLFAAVAMAISSSLVVTNSSRSLLPDHGPGSEIDERA